MRTVLCYVRRCVGGVDAGAMCFASGSTIMDVGSLEFVFPAVPVRWLVRLGMSQTDVVKRLRPPLWISFTRLSNRARRFGTQSLDRRETWHLGTIYHYIASR
jgi:hypothetical protein